MNKLWIVLLVPIAGLLLILGYEAASFLGPTSYEDCVLREMKGVDRSLNSLASAKCGREFAHSVDPSRFWLDWSGSTVSLVFQDKDYIPVSGVALVYNSDCKDIAKANPERVPLIFSPNGVASALHRSGPLCINLESIMVLNR